MTCDGWDHPRVKRGTAFWSELFLTRLNSEPTIIVRDVVAEVLERHPTSSEMGPARNASYRLAEGGHAVLMSLYPWQARGKDNGWGERRASCLTLDDALVQSLPWCVDRSATQGPGWTKDRESEAFKKASEATRPQLERLERQLEELGFLRRR